MVQDEKADAAIREHVGYAVVASAIPFPVADVVAVTAVQLDLVRQLAGIYGASYDETWGKAAVVSVTTAFGAARIGASAVKAIPGVGWFVGMTTQAALSGASTWAVGQLFKRHFAAGGTPDTFDLAQMREAYHAWLKRGRHAVESMWPDGAITSQPVESSQEKSIRLVERISRLRAEGALTEDEFNRLKGAALADS
jgi:uncharacterized protein (DUF697 family)